MLVMRLSFSFHKRKKKYALFRNTVKKLDVFDVKRTILDFFLGVRQGGAILLNCQ